MNETLVVYGDNSVSIWGGAVRCYRKSGQRKWRDWKWRQSRAISGRMLCACATRSGPEVTFELSPYTTNVSFTNYSFCFCLCGNFGDLLTVHSCTHPEVGVPATFFPYLFHFFIFFIIFFSFFILFSYFFSFFIIIIIIFFFITHI